MVPAVASAVRIVERLAIDWPSTVLPATLVRDLDLNRSTCYNILATLRRMGWVASVGDRAGYTLGPRLIGLSGIAPAAVTAVAEEEISALARRVGLSAYAAERDATGGYVVAVTAVPDTDLHVVVRPGAKLEFSAPALLEAFAAWMPVDRVQKLVEKHGLTRFTEYSTTDVAAFFAGLEDVRRNGYSQSLRKFNLSQAAVASPVFDDKGQPVLAICVLGFATDFDESSIGGIGEQARATADLITARIGGANPSGVGVLPADPAMPAAPRPPRPTTR
jgi:IclR family acetate operon transcriptional repressor